MKLDQQCQPIRLMLLDVDGVLTDGGVVLDNQGIESKKFHIRDGLAIKLWKRVGHRVGLVSSRNSHIVQVRADELGIDIVRQGVEDKLPVVKQILAELELQPHEVCYVGDDLPDLPVIAAVGLGVAVADPAAQVRRAAPYTTSAAGGTGAVRETVELVLKSQRRWDDLIQKYIGT
jgi:YrbI family 3-deoxy-D-manno-octulosonate 8-phosphate phosphatase